MLQLSRFSLPLRVYVCLNLAFSVVPSTSLAPTDVSITCRNFTNVLHWSYSEPEQQPEFYVTIRGYSGSHSEPISVQASQTYLDISDYTEDAADGYYVTVTAQPKGSEVNFSSEGVAFSYNEDIESDITCVVDFPELKVSVSPHNVELLFPHPYNVYGVDSLNDIFVYTISTNKTDVLTDNCYVEDDTCTAEVNPFESLYGSCINVHVKGSVNSVPTETSKKVCGHVPPEKDWTWILTILLCSVFVTLIIFILGAMIFKKLTQPDAQSTIFSKLMGMMTAERVIQEPEQPVVTRVMSVGHTPLMDATELTPSDLSSPTSEEKLLFPTHIPIPSKSDITFSDEQGQDEAMEDDDSGDFNSGNSFSGYDCQKFPIDMGQGDIVEGYGPR